MQCLINKGFCLHLLINFLSHLRHFTLPAILLPKVSIFRETAKIFTRKVKMVLEKIIITLSDSLEICRTNISLQYVLNEPSSCDGCPNYNLASGSTALSGFFGNIRTILPILAHVGWILVRFCTFLHK